MYIFRNLERRLYLENDIRSLY